MIEEKIKKLIANYEKEIGPISAHLIESDPDYKNRIIQEAVDDLGQKIAAALSVSAEFVEKETGARPRNDMPCFEPSKKIKFLKFNLTV